MQNPGVPLTERQKIAEIMFEHHGFEGVYFGIAPSFSVYAFGRKSGIVLDSGLDGSHVVPVYEEECMTHAIKHNSVGGNTISNYL